MSVFQHVKALIGVEDLAFGDSSSTFPRETHTGGSINISYIDAEIIPSTGLGGYIGDHLHVQDTDTGTTSDTFEINSDGNGATLSTTGLTSDRTFTFPNTGDQELIGATDLVSTSNGLGAALVGIEDSGGLISAVDVESALAEIAQDVADISHPQGYKYGFELGYSTQTAITIEAGMWSLWTTSESLVYTNLLTTFTLGSGGSNGSSEDLDAGAQELHYIYIDDSAVINNASALIAATEFLNTSAGTEVPTYNRTRKGWMNTSNDRCIGAVLIDASNHILDFEVFGGHYYQYATPIEEFAIAASGTTYQAVDVSSCVPKFSTRIRILVHGHGSTTFGFDTSSTSATPEAHYVVSGHSQTFDIPVSTSQVFYFKGTTSQSVAIYVVGYYLDEL